MHTLEIVLGFATVVVTNVIQIAYHHYHDRIQNGYLKRIAEKVDPNG